MTMPTSATKPSLDQLHTDFLEILPRIQTHGEVYFRHVRCPGKQEDAIAEMIAISWKWFRRLVEKGKEPTDFVSAIANFAARAVKSGRRLCRMEKTKDAMSSRAQQLGLFTVSKLPDFSTLSSNPLVEALTDNTQTPPDEQVAFRIDFPVWLGSLGDFKRRVAEELMVGERTLDVANQHGISSARISQLRREFRDDWNRFCL